MNNHAAATKIIAYIISIIFLTLLLASCGQAVAPETIAVPTTTEAPTITEPETTAIIELDAPSFETALQEKYANWREGYMAVLRARWHEYMRLDPRSPEIVFCLTDYDRDGTPELLIKLYVISDFIHAEHLFTFEDGNVCPLDLSQYPEPQCTEDLWGSTDSDDGISAENFNRVADAFEQIRG